MLEILDHCCFDEETKGRVCEVGGPDVMSYREMMQATARVLGRKRPMIPVPLVTPALSELWVSLVTGTSRSLVRPLIQSLRHPMVAEDRWLQERMGLSGRPFEEALAESVASSRVFKRPIARSVQRAVLPRGRDARWVGEEYTRWLARLLPLLLAIDSLEDRIRIRLRPFRKPMLELTRRREAEKTGRYLLGVTGGALAREAPQGDPRLEFRMSPDGEHVLIALQDFEPRLPWWLYAWTQAHVHTAVMFAFRRHLAAFTA